MHNAAQSPAPAILESHGCAVQSVSPRKREFGPTLNSARRPVLFPVMAACTLAACTVIIWASGGSAQASAGQPQGVDRVRLAAPAPPPPPIYGKREIADAELALLDAETVLTYWSEQEDKWNGILTGTDNAQLNEREAAFARQALSNALRSQSAKIDAGLQRERAAKRLEAMKNKNIEVQGTGN